LLRPHPTPVVSVVVCEGLERLRRHVPAGGGHLCPQRAQQGLGGNRDEALPLERALLRRARHQLGLLLVRPARLTGYGATAAEPLPHTLNQAAQPRPPRVLGAHARALAHGAHWRRHTLVEQAVVGREYGVDLLCLLERVVGIEQVGGLPAATRKDGHARRQSGGGLGCRGEATPAAPKRELRARGLVVRE
jgi:hypothetical protein